MEILKLIDENTYIVSDTHLFHDKIVEYEPIRKRCFSEGFPSHEDCIIEKWNSVVGEGELILHLGDFLFKPQYFLEFTEFLNGRKILIGGNHDAKGRFLENYKRYFEAVVAQGKVAIVSDQGVEIIKTKHPLANGIVKTLKGLKILFSHYPVYLPQGIRSQASSQLAEVFKELNCDLNIHGHVHSKTINHPRLINASLEVLNLKPVSLRELIAPFLGV